ncbi:hypothetical protein V5799_031001 [Amblyomma americanum]|uniref:Uncharacterized protein n=1 Tax=Amblyomma americanum TaxID=6943 RepID=A0AAQ4ELJ9_AMBAM
MKALHVPIQETKRRHQRRGVVYQRYQWKAKGFTSDFTTLNLHNPPPTARGPHLALATLAFCRSGSGCRRLRCRLGSLGASSLFSQLD